MTPKCIVVVMDLVIDNPIPSKSETEISMCHWVVEFIIANKNRFKMFTIIQTGNNV